ncbi:MAG: hypothetical protein WBB82_13945 [Limnothrix sp.]
MKVLKYTAIVGEVVTVTTLFSLLARCFPVLQPVLLGVIVLLISGGAIACSMIKKGEFRQAWVGLSTAIFLGVVGAWF